MAYLPPRKTPSNKILKQDTNPLHVLLQMGFPKNRALKALAATGNRSVQLASDWLLTHVNDAHIDEDQPREYILYASPSGSFLIQLLEFWNKSQATGWNGAHNFPPHITLVPFFKANDDISLQLGKAVKQAVESVGIPPYSCLKWEPYISQNFMGLFVSDEHADYLKKIADQYTQIISSILGVMVHNNGSSESCIKNEELSNSSTAEAQAKSLHLTLAYHFDVSAYNDLKQMVNDLDLSSVESSTWELRLYSRDPRFANHQVHKVIQSYVPEASDELELVLGDYIYIEEKQFDTSPDGWVYGTSWLTGVSGQLPGVYTRRTSDSDAWTLHRAISLSANKSSDSKSESGSKAEVEMSTNYPHEDAEKLGFEKSEESYQVWEEYWKAAMEHKTENILKAEDSNGKVNGKNGDLNVAKTKSNGVNGTQPKADRRRWIFAMRHGERVDLTYGAWVPFCFDENGTYTRKDLNMPLTLAEREGGADSYAKDAPLTRVGQMQAYLVGEGLRAARVPLRHVYASPSLRCVETAHNMLQGLKSDPPIKIKIEPGLFEYKLWHASKGMGPFMTPMELHKAGYNVDLNYKPYVEMDVHAPETMEEFYKRNEFSIQSAVKNTEAEGGNIMFVGHATTLDIVVTALKRMQEGKSEYPEYQLAKFLNRVPYCALGALRDDPIEVVSPPCPPSINSSSGRFDWKLLLEVDSE